MGVFLQPGRGQGEHIEMEDEDKEESFLQKNKENLKPKTEEQKKREYVLRNTNGNFAERKQRFRQEPFILRNPRLTSDDALQAKRRSRLSSSHSRCQGIE